MQAADTLDIYFVNAGKATGANATILVAPSGESAMLDAGLPNQAPRVLAVFKQAGVKQLDYLVNTHFHADHFGGTARLAEQFPIINFVDHGETVEYGKSDEWWEARRTGAKPGMGKRYDALYDTYLKAVEKGRRITVKAGDVIPIKGIEMKVVCAGGKTIAEPLAGAGQPNPYCDGAERRGVDDAEDAQSIGVLVTLRGVQVHLPRRPDLERSLDLFCPRNKVGTVDAYLITHHAQSYDATMGAYYFGLSAAPKAEVHGLRPAGGHPQPGEPWDTGSATRRRWRPSTPRPASKTSGRPTWSARGARRSTTPRRRSSPISRTSRNPSSGTSSCRPAPTARSP